MPVDKKKQALLSHAASQMRIMDIFLRGMNVSMADRLNPVLQNQEFRFQFRFTPKQQSIQTLERIDLDNPDSKGRESVEIVEYQVEAAARFLDPQLVLDDSSAIDPSAVLVEIIATFSATYARNDCTDEAIKVFGIHNVPLHVWPFWRELLQNTLSRMKMPSVTLGMYVPSKGVHALAILDDPDSLKVTSDAQPKS